MSSDLAIEPNGSDGRPPIPGRRSARPAIKYVPAALAVASWLGMPLLSFSFPALFGWLIVLYLLCLLALFVVLLCVLFRRRWNEVAILLVVWTVVLFPIYGPIAPNRWLYAEAFRIHASPIEEYMSRCKLFEFVENGVKQTLGRCEILPTGDEGVLCVFYDTTGEFVLPVSQRTPEWRAAMWHFSPHALLLETEGRATRIFGNFYDISIASSEYDGDDERY